MGWSLSLGSLFPVINGDQVDEYVAPDGSEHLFYATLHDDDSGPTANFEYTRDGSYLRRYKGTTTATVEFPDGTIHTFVPSTAGTCTPTTCSWLLSQMADRFGNAVTVKYGGTTDAPTWTVSDSTGRSHTITFGSSSTGIRRLTSVSLAAFGGTTASFTLSYPPADSVIEVSEFEDTCGNTFPATATVTFLTGITLPDNTAYTMGDTNGPWYYTASDAADTSGVLYKLQVPTAGIAQWTYADWGFPLGCLYASGSLRPDLTSSLGVATRALCDSSGGNCATWSYTRPTPGNNDDYITTTVTSPPAIPGAAGNDGVGNDTVFYFRTHSCITSGTDYSAWDYGLPYTQSVSDGSGHYLSSQSYQGTGGTRSLMRSTYVAFEHDHLPTLATPPPGLTWDASPWWSTNRRMVYKKTVYADDSNKYADVTSSSFDGLGHYRQAVTGGNFASGNARTGFAGLNPDPVDQSYRTYQINASNTQTGTWAGWTWSTSKPWILGTFNLTQETEGGVTAYQEFCFEKDGQGYPTTGFLRASRVLKSATEDQHDLLQVNTRDASGQVITEQYLGGDTQSQALPPYCGTATSTVTGDTYRIEHRYLYDVLRRSWYADSSGSQFSSYTLDLDIDPNTGLPSASRDTAGLQTAYAYDNMYRLTWEMPTSGAYVEHQYTAWPGTDDQNAAHVDHCTKANGNTSTVCSPSSDSRSRSSMRFDGFGRPYLGAVLVPINASTQTWNQQRTTYNGMGWATAVSEWYKDGDPIYKTQYSNFDPFGRPGTITPPDTSAHNVTVSYLGVRQVARTVKVQTFDSYGQNPAERDSTTTEVYDRQGRLYTVQESSGTGGATTTTLYGYDVGGRLTKMCTPSSQDPTCANPITYPPQQIRWYNYDKRGFMTSEQLPEKGANGNGAVTYSSYDARGHAQVVVDGPNSRSYAYDRAERPTGVTVTGGNALVALTYDGATGYGGGKLYTATRHNWIGGVDSPVVETYTYNGVGGAVSQRTTTVEGRTIDQTFAWTDLGLPSTIGYPDDSMLASDPTRSVGYGYALGFLTGVPDFAPTITYAINMTPSQITYANGVSASFGLDLNDMQRVGSIQTSGASNNWSTGTYAYDGAGNIKSVGTQTFVYDQVSRLVTANILANGSSKQQTASFDAFGNITSTYTSDWGTQTLATTASTNRLTTAAGYDAAGDVTSWYLYSYTWDALGKLQTVTGGGINHAYLYTADGERIADRDATASSTTITVRDLDGQVLRTFIESGTSGTGALAWGKDYIRAGRALLAEVSANPDEGTRYFALDHLGTPRLVTSACGATLARHDYYPFGMEATSSQQDGERMKFTGHERDLMGTYSSQTDDLDNMHARFYNPNIARFIRTDLLRGDPHAPQSFNLFAYVAGNPMNFVDPAGLVLENMSGAKNQYTGFDDYLSASILYGLTVTRSYNDTAVRYSQASSTLPATWYTSGADYPDVLTQGGVSLGVDVIGTSAPASSFTLLISWPGSGGGAGPGGPGVLGLGAVFPGLAANGRRTATRMPWYKNGCVQDAIVKGAGSAALDAIGLLPEGGAVSAAFSLFHGAAAVSNGTRTLQGVKMGANLASTASAGSEGSGLSTGLGVLGIGATLGKASPVVGQFIAGASLVVDVSRTWKAAGQCD